MHNEETAVTYCIKSKFPRTVRHNSNEFLTAKLRQKPTTIFMICCLFFCVACSLQAPREKLEVVASEPEPGGQLVVGEPMRIQFNSYLDLGTLNRNALTLTSGEIEVGVEVGYDPVDRSLLVRSLYPLRPKLNYVLSIEAGAIESIEGFEFQDEFELTVQTVSATPLQAPPRNKDRKFSEIKVIFERSCNCHGPEPKAFPELVPDVLFTQSSIRQPEFDLVKKGQPLRSYLVLRLLDKYPGIRGTPKDVTPNDLRHIIDWIAQLDDQ